jgi:hypothetical protein
VDWIHLVIMAVSSGAFDMEATIFSMYTRTENHGCIKPDTVIGKIGYKWMTTFQIRG